MPINPTEAQRDASRLNGQKSHGPVTEEGKANSSKNSFKFGFYAKSVLAEGESQEEYDAHCAKIRGTYECLKGHEEILLDSLCNTEWMLVRCERLQAAIVGAKGYFKKLAILSQHHNRLQRIRLSTMDALQDSIHKSEVEEKEQFDLAAIVRRADFRAGRKSNLAELGFDLTNDMVDNHIFYQNVIQAAKDEVLGCYSGDRTE
jgi:hypothetical protein